MNDTANKPAEAAQPAASIDPFDPDSFKTPDIMTAEAAPAADSADSAPAGEKVPEVKLLVFDMGHVFVDFEWEEVCKGFYTRSGHTRDEFKKVLSDVAKLGYERGTISTENFLTELNSKLGLTLTVEEFTTLWNATFRENPEMAQLLQDLSLKYPLYLLSNTNEIHYRHLQDSFNVARHFKELILSYQVGMAKPDRGIYEIVLERSGLPAEHCLFVDDLPPNIQAAQSVGMRAIQFKGIEDLKQQLAALGVTV
jgi:putative hydrolase of the HAD superfamily